MCFFVKVFFDLVDGLRHRPVRALLVQAAETGQNTVDQELLLFLNLFDFFF